MTTVRRRRADVVDRRRRLGDDGGEGGSRRRAARSTRLAVSAAEPKAARTSPASRSTTTQSEQIAITIAFRTPTFMNVCGPPVAVRWTAVTSSSGRERGALHPEQELLERQGAHAADARELDLGALDEERRQRVARGRGGAEVPADRAAVPDLRRADRARRLGERRAAPRRAAAPSPGCTSAPPRAAAGRPPATSRGAPRARRG